MGENSSRICLCLADSKRDSYLHKILDIAIETLERSESFKEATVILTGSLARGEGSVLLDENGFRSLSDMEFLVTCDLQQSLQLYISELNYLENKANQDVVSAGMNCKIEYTFALDRFFQSARPSIFVCELKSHGKVVKGPVELFNRLHGCLPQDIPKIDAFYLLCNRIVEQLGVLGQYYGASRTVSEEVFKYTILKFYVDIATSLLVFIGNYSPNYCSRRDSFMELSSEDIAVYPSLSALRERIDYWTSVKLCPTKAALSYTADQSPLDEWLELAGIALSVWDWELTRLVGNSTNAPELLQKKFIWSCNGYLDTAREIIKYAIKSIKNKDMGKMEFRYFLGYPRHILYIEAVKLYRQLTLKCKLNHNISGTSILTFSEAQQINHIKETWTLYFRNA